MPRLTFAPFAAQSVRDLPADKTLLQNLWRQLERVANDLENLTEFPPPFPHRQDRRLAAFIVYDGAGDRWGVSATLADGGEEVTVCTLSATRAGAYIDPDGTG